MRDGVVEALDVDVRTSGHVGRAADGPTRPSRRATGTRTGAGRRRPSRWARRLLRRAAPRTAQQLVLLGGEPTGHVDVDAHEQIAAPRPRSAGTPRPLSRNTCRAACPRDDELLGAVERLDVEARAQRRLRERDAPHVHAGRRRARSKRGSARDAHGDVEVAGDAAARRGRAAARQAEPLAVVDTGGHFDVDRARRAHASVAAALVARSGNAAAGGAARDARRRGDDLAEDRAPHLAHLAGAAAHVAARRVRAGLAAGALAARARDREADVDGRGGAERGLREVEVHDGFGVGRAWRAGLAATAEGVAAEERVEEVAEPERIAGRRPASTGRRARAVFAEHVVAATALGIAQRLVRLARPP